MMHWKMMWTGYKWQQKEKHLPVLKNVQMLQFRGLKNVQTRAMKDKLQQPITAETKRSQGQTRKHEKKNTNIDTSEGRLGTLCTRWTEHGIVEEP